MEALLATLPAGGVGAVAAAATAVGLAAITGVQMKPNKRANMPPEVPGLPLIGNLHQLNGTKPHVTFEKWSETYGPIYTARIGASPYVVLNSIDVVKEAMVEKFSSISTRKLPKAFTMVSRDKLMVSISDYGDFHKMVKRFIMAGLLGPNAQKQFRDGRKQMMDNLTSTFRTLVTNDPHATQNFREVFKAELFRLAVIQIFGEDMRSIYVEEFGREVSKDEICQIMVADTLTSLADIDWRDFFPYLSWIPNKEFDLRVTTTETRRTAVTHAMINQRKERIERGEASVSYLDFLLEKKDTLTDEELMMLVWEAALGGTDTTVMATEWAMYEVAKNPEKQDRLYREIQEVCGDDTVDEDHLSRLPYLKAVFHETLRLHSPGTLLPPRFVHETTTLAGYEVPAGSEVMINMYGCNMNNKDWAEPDEWRPERFLDDGFDDYMPISFGAGRRTCPGAAQATTISCLTIARCVQEFAWRLKKGDEDKPETAQYVGARLHPLYVHLSPRR